MIESGPSRLMRLLEEPVTDEVPEGWMTADQLARGTGMSRSACVNMAVAEELPCRSFRVDARGTSRPVKHYFVGTKKTRLPRRAKTGPS